ncbi:MAG: segregation and condensation protein A [Candidatus Poriferisodalaceae bacterium]|jgi:segregation and condensation protein A
MSYEVQTPVFEGPFDLLLHLILKDQVDIYEVSLSNIVDAYLGELDRMIAEAKLAESLGRPGELDLDIATEFLLIAATLVELKTRRLLPAESDIDLDDELAIWEERDLLLSRLLECKTFKNAAAMLRQMAVQASRSHPRTAGADERYYGVAPDLLAGVSPDDLAAAFVRAVTPKPVPHVTFDHINPIRASVVDAISELMEELPRLGKMTFRALTDGLVDRIEVVVRFLAILELFKEGLVDLNQTGRFGDITIAWLGGDSDQLVPIGVDTYDG